jgi:hypothetical protein
MSIYDFPLDNFPSLIATLIRQRTLKMIRRELEAQGRNARSSLSPRASGVVPSLFREPQGRAYSRGL